jgi:hypothetical protein
VESLYDGLIVNRAGHRRYRRMSATRQRIARALKLEEPARDWGLVLDTILL